MSIRTLSRTRARLCSLAQVRESIVRAGLTLGAVSDETLALLLDGVRSAFERELGRPILRGTYEEVLAGTNRARVYLTGTPVASFSLSLILDGEEVTDWTVTRSTGEVYRDAGVWPERAREGESGRKTILATYTGGYVAPSLLLDWAPSVEIEAGQWLRHPTRPCLLLECTSGGTLAAEAPTWPSEDGASLTSGSAELTTRDAEELPEQLRDLAAYSAMTAYQALSTPAGLISIEAEGVKATFAQATAPTVALPAVVSGALAAWRWQL